MSLPLAKTEVQIIGVVPAGFTAAHRETRGHGVGEAIPGRQIKEQPAKTEIAESTEKGFSKSRHGLSGLASIA